ncbi:hypothetical protein BDA96_06G108300 [Sorghum bicolor]|uniref:Uncharacterized protein n=1 Tax=Sorghum bicolor TaxID=4558 RepID=A0A921QSB3_SORBI|nr:hypothetical protein BDA96_06G108300 [Sorghum bicolor]
MRAQGSVWVRPKLSSGKASSASRKSKGASPAAAAAPHILPPPNRRELHRRLRPGHREQHFQVGLRILFFFLSLFFLRQDVISNKDNWISTYSSIYSMSSLQLFHIIIHKVG